MVFYMRSVIRYAVMYVYNNMVYCLFYSLAKCIRFDIVDRHFSINMCLLCLPLKKVIFSGVFACDSSTAVVLYYCYTVYSVQYIISYSRVLSEEKCVSNPKIHDCSNGDGWLVYHSRRYICNHLQTSCNLNGV